MTEPTWGQKRMMIYKPRTRLLDDGCLICGASIPSCDSGPQPCCKTCQHRSQAKRPE